MAYINLHGCVIPKTLITAQDIQKIKQELTVKPEVSKNHPNPYAVPSFPVYLENDSKLYVPRNWALNRGPPIPPIQKQSSLVAIAANGCKPYAKMSERVAFKGNLKEDQKEPVAVCLQALKDERKQGGILSLKCGQGKTICALWLAVQLRAKTLIIVHKTFLMNQWIERIQQFLPLAKIGRIQQKTVDIEGKDIVIGMLKSIAMCKYKTDLFDSFGFTIIDEVHNIAAEVSSRALFKVNTRYHLGLSATPDRQDKLENVFKWHIGEVIYARKQEINGLAPVICVYYYHGKDIGFTASESDEEANAKTVTNKYGKQQKMVNIPKMITKICKNENRNDFITTIIKSLVQDSRRVLVLSERIEHLEILQQLLADSKIKHPTQKQLSALYIGRTTEQERYDSEDAGVIFGTLRLIKEGYDNPRLDTLIFASFNGGPTSGKHETEGSLEQTMGRIFRKTHTEKHPMIIDISDQYSAFTRQGARRTAYYKKQKDYIVRRFTVKNNEITELK